jgi:GntR family transcriptional regulator / MocR family aminotransferase
MEPLLPLTISLHGRGSLLHDLHRQLRTAIVDGRLRPGLRLPSTRSLAAAYGVSRNTAVATYDLLLSEGYTVTRRGSGTRVAETLPRPPKNRPSRNMAATSKRRVSRVWRERADRPSPPVPVSPPLSFKLGIPDVSTFPFEIWRRLSIEVYRTVPTSTALDADPQGRLGFREAIAQHISFTRAVACGPEDIVVTSGAQQAFDLLARVLVTPQRTRVALEDPGYPPLRATFEAAGARILSIPVDHDGLMVDRLPSNTRIICVTPSHQFPLGCVLSARRRAALLDFAQARGAVVIEDDYDGEFRFTDRPLDALQTLDRAESVFYVGTFSKSLLPTLRLGYIVTPPWARPALLAAKTLADGPCCGPTQDIVAALIRGGHLARHVRKMRHLYARRRQTLLDLLARDLPCWLEPVPSSAGLHIAATFKARVDDRAVAEQLFREGIGIRALSAFSHRRSPPRGLVLGYGAIQEPAIVNGMAHIRRWLSAPARLRMVSPAAPLPR